MKRLLVTPIICLVLVCCKKDNAPEQNQSDLKNNISRFLNDSLTIDDRQNLVMGSMRIGTLQDGTARYVRIPMKNSEAFSEFIYSK